MSELGLNMQAEPPRTGKDPQKMGRGPVILAVFVFAAVLAVIGAVFLKDRVFPSGDDYSGAGSGEVTVQVKEGETLADIGSTLKENGVVASVQSFIDAAAANSEAQSIGPGYYQMSQHMSGEEAVKRMLDPASRVVIRVVIPEGLREDQVVRRLSEASKIPKAKFEAVLKDAGSLGLPKWAKGNAEGFLFPATYEFAPDSTPKDMIAAMISRWNESADTLQFTQNAKETGYSPYEVMIIASLVQAEGHPNDYGKVSRVIYNRLAAGMPLQLDATVNYVLKKSEINLSPDQIATDSPYNTYKNTGLPPTPINQPGEAAMTAALQPDEGDWLYFVAVNPDTGETKFTSDYNEFLQFKKEFEKYVAENP
ncbi:MAG: endolytic transglycosylase MltG [Candidatus Nanopelagicales bacterium]